MIDLASAPDCLHWLWIEVYAITGVMVTLLMWFALLDLGLILSLRWSVTQLAAFNRIANWHGGVLAGPMLRIRGLALAVTVTATVPATAPWIAETWIKAASLSAGRVVAEVVPPDSIFVGSPAQVIRMRFPEYFVEVLCRRPGCSRLTLETVRKLAEHPARQHDCVIFCHIRTASK